MGCFFCFWIKLLDGGVSKVAGVLSSLVVLLLLLLLVITLVISPYIHYISATAVDTVTTFTSTLIAQVLYHHPTTPKFTTPKFPSFLFHPLHLQWNPRNTPTKIPYFPFPPPLLLPPPPLLLHPFPPPTLLPPTPPPMDHHDPPPRSTLRQPFIHTANALASLYKQASLAEQQARQSGSSAAYRAVMQWAACADLPLTPARLIAFCASELADASPDAVQPQIVPVVKEEPEVPKPPPCVARDEALVSDINRMYVNPKKRQRVEISDTFIRAYGEAQSFAFPVDHQEGGDDYPSNRRVKTKTVYDKLRKK